MKLTKSLRRLNAVAMGGMIVLLLAIAGLSISTLRTITRQTAGDIAELENSTRLGNALVSSVLEEIRAAEQYLLAPNPGARAQFLESGDSAYAHQGALRELAP